MGVVNVTPDSFSDGGRYLDPGAAVQHGRRLTAEGAQILDVGGESTRPGAEEVPADEELRRVVPVIEGLAGGDATVSIDTSKAVVAEAALDAGAGYVNDVTAFRGDPAPAGVVASREVPCCLMHMLGTPRTMQQDPRYDDVVSEVKAFLEARLARAVHEGGAGGAGSAAPRVRGLRGRGRGARDARSRHRLRQDRRAQPRADPAARRDRRARAAGGVRRLAQVVPREADRPRGRRAGGRDRRRERARARAGRLDLPCPRRAGDGRCAHRGRCYVDGPMARDEPEDYDDDDLTDDDDDEREGPEVGVTVEIVGLSLYTHHGVSAAEREIGQRLVLDVRFDVGEP